MEVSTKTNNESNHQEETYSNEDEEDNRPLSNEKQCSIQQTGYEDDIEFTLNDLNIIRSLLLLAPAPSCKETKRLLNGVRSTSLRMTYDRILDLSKATNKEFVHYLSVIERYPHCLLNYEKLANLKFISHDKYLSQVIFIYFSLVNKYYSKLSKEQRFSIFYRYIYLFSNHISIDLSVYRLFKTVLKEDLLAFFISKRYYRNFLFLREFLCDFSQDMNEKIIRIGYEIHPFRELVYNLATNSSLYTDWLVQRWNIPLHRAIPQLFYSFDCAYYLDDIGSKRFKCVENPLDLINMELSNPSRDCSICNMNNIDEHLINDQMMGKARIRKCIEEFNTSSDIIREPLTILNIRLFPSVDLKALGRFLCKASNIDQLRQFTESFDFRETDILDSLRSYLKSFVLPGESQIIDRITTIFTETYINQNALFLKMPVDQILDSMISKYKKIIYGFIMLNTMLYNPSFEKKPSFEDYLELLEYSEVFAAESLPWCPLDKESLKAYYESIKDDEMKLPTIWSDGFDKYLLAIKVRKSDNSPFSPVEGNRTNEIQICTNCIKLAYKHLFENSLDSFMFLSPEPFFQICKLLGCRTGFEHYMLLTKKDLDRSLESYRLYLEAFPSNASMIEDFLNCLERTEKPKSSVLTDIKSIFSKSATDLREKSHPTLMQFIDILKSINSITFVDGNVCTINCELLSKAMKNRKSYVRGICVNIIVNNAVLINDFSNIDKESSLKLLSSSPGEYLNRMPDHIKITYFRDIFQKGEVTKENYEIFKKIELYDQEAFDAYCSAQHAFNDFDRVVQIRKISIDSKEQYRYEIEELYSKCMKDPQNILKFFTASSSILNIKIAKKIHRDSCPLNDPVFNDTNRFIYLALKCDINDQALYNYTAYLVNYLSDSLVLLLNIYEDSYPIFFQIQKELVNGLIRILIKRIKLFIESDIACCEATKVPEVTIRTRSFVQRLIADGLANAYDFKFLVGKGMVNSEVVEL